MSEQVQSGKGPVRGQGHMNISPAACGLGTGTGTQWAFNGNYKVRWGMDHHLD